MTTSVHSRFAISDHSFAHFAAVAVAASVLLALLGPFGTMLTMAWPQRFAHWLVSGCAIAALTAGGLAGLRRLRGKTDVPFWMIGAVAALAALPGAFIVEACLRVWSPQSLPHVSIGQLMAQCLLLNVVLTLIAAGALRRRVDAAAAPLAPGAQGEAQLLLQRLPRAFHGAKLYAIAAEDHYLRIHTDRGATLIHMRLSDAEALLRNADGLRVHRSHWVARAALAGVKRQKGQTTLVLVNGLEAPVSRARQDAVKQAGWLDI